MSPQTASNAGNVRWVTGGGLGNNGGERPAPASECQYRGLARNGRNLLPPPAL